MLLLYLRKRKHVLCFYHVIEIQVKVCENKKCCVNEKCCILAVLFWGWRGGGQCLWTETELRSINS